MANGIQTTATWTNRISALLGRPTTPRRRKALAEATRPVFEQLEGRRLLSGSSPFQDPVCIDEEPDVWINGQALTPTKISDDCGSARGQGAPPGCQWSGPAEGSGIGGNPADDSLGGGGNEWWASGMPEANTTSRAPVRYFDGLAIVGSSDVSTDASGRWWGHSRSWRGDASTGHWGNGWFVMELPSLSWQAYEGDLDANGEESTARRDATGVVGAIDSGGNRRYFDYHNDGSSRTLTARDGRTDTLEIDAGGSWILRDERGGETTYHALAAPDADGDGPVLSGQFERFETASGVTVVPTWAAGTGGTTEGELLRVDVSDASAAAVERFTYGYADVTGGGETVRRVASVTHGVANGSGGYTDERSTTYSYYTGAETGAAAGHGRLGDLKLVEVRDGGTSAEVIEGKYYRYASLEADGTTAVEDGYTLLKSAFEGEAFDRMAAAYPSFETASDGDIEPFVDHYFEYEKWESDAAYGLRNGYRVVLEIAGGEGCSSCAGGQGTFKFEYETNDAASVAGTENYETIERNIWRVKTTEYLPDTTAAWSDNDRNVVYTNEMGQVVMQVYEEHDAGGPVERSVEAFRYDDDGRLLVAMQPSALAGIAASGPDETEPDLIGFNPTTGKASGVSETAGLVWLYDWYDGSQSGDDNATEIAAGGALGYLASVAQSRGLDGDANDDVTLAELAYKRRTAGGGGGVTSVQLAETTRYRNSDNTGGITTSYDFTWYAGSVQVESMTTHFAAATAAQNGPGTAESTTSWYDSEGRVVWMEDEAGHLSFTGYDAVTGAAVLRVVDADPATVDSTIADAGDELDLDAGVKASTLGITRDAGLPAALHLETRAIADELGRTVKVTDPNGNVTWTVYNDADYETRVYPGWNPTTGETTGPVQVSRQVRDAAAFDHDGKSGTDDVGRVFNESLTYTGTLNTTGSAGDLRPAGTESIASMTLHTLSRSITNASGQVVQADRYHDLDSLAYATNTAELGAAGDAGGGGGGSGGGVRHESFTAYDERGRAEVMTDANGTITWRVHDGQSRLLSVWTGTDATGGKHGDPEGTDPANNLRVVATYEYDHNGSGDGTLTRMVQHVDATAASNRVTLYDHDWRNRLVLTRTGVEDLGSGNASAVAYTYTTLDNLGRATRTQRFGAGQGSLAWGTDSSGVPLAPGSQRSHDSRTYFDERGRVYEQRTYSVNPTTGVLGDYLTSNAWYDARGLTIKSAAPGGLVTKHACDGAGRRTLTSLTDGGGDSSYADASTVTGDIVLEEHHTEYDAAGNAILSTTKQRHHDATGTGSLGDANGGVPARVSYAAAYHDALNRPTDSVNVGTNGGGAYTRPATVPARGDGVLVTSTRYDDAGRVGSTIDPRGIVDLYDHDALGRRVALTESFDGLLDSFDRPDGSLGAADTGQVWNVAKGTWEVQERAAISREAHDGGGMDMAVLEGAADDGAAQARIGELGSGVTWVQWGIVGRFEDADNFYLLKVDNSVKPVRLYERRGGAYTLLWQSSQPAVDGDTLRLEMRGDAARVYLNDALLTTQALPSGGPGGTKWGMASLYDVDSTFEDFRFTRSDDSDANRITRWAYDGNGSVASMTADLPADQEDQTTTYGYAASTTRGDAFFSNSVLTETSYPSVGGSTATDETYTVNRAGQRETWTDRNGTTHAYDYDLLGRLTADEVTAFGTGVDQAVDALTTSYDDAGRVFSLKSLSGTSIVNEVQRHYNGLGQLTEELQEHDGAVDASTLGVGYAYSEMANGANHSRMTGMTYPDGTVLSYDYTATPAGLNDDVSRLSSLTWDATTAEAYDYLGLSTIVGRRHPEADLDLVYYSETGTTGPAGDQYTGLDRFGRVVDQRWVDSSGGGWSDVDRFGYGHDRNGNRLYEENLVQSTLSELYVDPTSGEYDQLDRLTQFSRGTLNTAKDGLTGSASRSQDWDLDALGNWNSVTDETSTTQTRTHDAQNRITGVSGASTPTHSANGEMTADETGQELTYDAWGRVVYIDPDAGLAGNEVHYAYDALARRVETDDGTDHTHLFYSQQWQVLEERADDGSGGAASTAHTQHVWSPAYVDAMVLRDRDTDPNTTGLEERVYVTHDANFNVTAILKHDGTGEWDVVERYLFDPYGERTVLDADWTLAAGNSSPVKWLYGHQGLRYDGAAGLWHARFRDLNRLGRWGRQDPMGYVDGTNLFQYVGSSTISWLDPIGLDRYDFDIVPRDGEDPAMLVSKFLGMFATAFSNGQTYGGDPHRFYIEPTCAEDMAQKIIDKMKELREDDNDAVIGSIRIRSHGSSGSVRIGYNPNLGETHIGKNIDPNSREFSDKLSALLTKLDIYTDDQSDCILWTCKTGRSGRFMQLLADLIGAEVHALTESTDSLTVIRGGGWVITQPGKPVPPASDTPGAPKK